MKKSKNKYIYVGRKDPHFYSMTPEEYGEYTELYTILTEATKLLLRKVQANPNALIQEFTSQHLKGEQVLLKAYANFSKSPINRLTFLSNFVKVFEIEEERNDRNGIDYLQLLRLVCSDFPREIVLYSLRLCCSDWVSDDEIILEKPYSSSAFVQAFYFNFMYFDFVRLIEKNDKSKLREYFQSFKAFYQGNSAHQLQRPSFAVMVSVLLSLSRQESNGVVFVSEDKIESYLQSDNIGWTTVLRAFFESQLNIDEISEMLDMPQSLAVRVADISRIATEKVDFGLDGASSKKNRKK